MDALLTHSAYQSLLVLWLAVLVDALWRWPLSSHPLTLMRYLVKQMGARVLPGKAYPQSSTIFLGRLRRWFYCARLLFV